MIFEWFVAKLLYTAILRNETSFESVTIYQKQQNKSHTHTHTQTNKMKQKLERGGRGGGAEALLSPG